MESSTHSLIKALPHLNACLNLVATSLLILGYLNIRRKRVARHKRCMLAAFGCSAAFLISYVVHKITVGTTTFRSDFGWLRTVYLSILVSHFLLAMLVPPLALTAIVLALKNKIAAHRRLARITLPIWLYVSITGVIVYLMLYHL
jgi:uncharacterized membrane protein YozB (DUF420 family)